MRCAKFVLPLGLLLAAPAMAAGITASGGWALATPPHVSAAAAYVTIVNQGADDDVLTGASAAVAGNTSLHQTLHQNGVDEMRPLPSLTVKAGQSVSFAPGGMHIMLMGLKQRLVAGQHFSVVLRFAKAGAVVTDVVVKPDAPAAAPAMSMPGMNM